MKTSCPNIAKNLFILLIVSFGFVALLFTPTLALTSENINFQGKIVRNDTGYEGLNVVAGTPACVVSGSGNDTCDFQIAYYTASSGGTLLLTESFTNVEIGQYDGVFELSLGNGTVTTTSVCRDGTCNTVSEVLSEYFDVYVELKFAPDGTNLTETFTRMPLEANAYSIFSKYSEGAHDGFKLSTSLSSQTQSTPTTGMIYYNTTDSKVKVYNGSTWEDVGGSTSLWSDPGTFTYLTSATDDLVLGATTVADGTFFFDVDGSSGSYFEVDSGDNLSRLFTILANGNVGIGTDNPGAKLEVAGASSNISNSSGDLTISTGGGNGNLIFSPNGTGSTLVQTKLGIKETGSTPTYYTYFLGGDQSGDITYTLPTSSSTGLLKNTAGVLSWDTNTYITGLNWSQVTNGTGVYMDYKPNDTACTGNQVLKYSVGTGWICADDSTGSATAWDDISDPDANTVIVHGAYTTDMQFDTFTSGSGFKFSSASTGLTGTLVDVTLSGSNVANTGNLLSLSNTGTLNTNTTFLINHYATGTGNLALRVNDVSGDTTPFVIDGAGNVGIGTASPGGVLEVSGGTTKLYDGDTTGTITLDIGDNFRLKRASDNTGYNIADYIFEAKGNASFSDVLRLYYGGAVAYNMYVDTFLHLRGAQGLIFKSGSAAYEWQITYSGNDLVIKHDHVNSAPTWPSTFLTIKSTGNVGIGVASPTAVLHLNAGTATASSAPLKFTAGTNLTNAESGAMEWDGSRLYITDTTPTRNTIAYTSDLSSFITGVRWDEIADPNTSSSIAHGAYLSEFTFDSIATGSGFKLSSTSTAGTASSSSTMLEIARSGANSNLAHSAYGIYSTVTNTNATSGTNIAGYFSASGATTANYGLLVANGNVGVGTTTPSALLSVGANSEFTVDTGGNISLDDNTSSSPWLKLVNQNDRYAQIDYTNGDILQLGLIASSARYWALSGVRQTGNGANGDTNSISFYLEDNGGANNNENTRIETTLVDSTGGSEDASLSFYTSKDATLTQKMIIDPSGNVGIGTSSATGRIHSYISNSAVTGSNYTGYFENLATNTTTDGINKYGAYITSTGTFTGSTGTATNNYGLYVDVPSGADNNYAAIFSGYVGIGTNTPRYSLSVVDTPTYTTANITNAQTADSANYASLALRVGTTTTGTSTRFIKFVANAVNDNDGTLVGYIKLNNNAVAYSTTAADFAEYFSMLEATEPGDIVMSTTTGNKKAISNQGSILGVVSDTSGFIGNAKDDTKTPDKAIVGLIGQINTKVSNINGEIKKGDKVTISSIPGFGMKATKNGEIIGHALEDFNLNNQISCPLGTPSGVTCGKIKIYVSRTWYNPSQVSTTEVLTQSGWYRIAELSGPDDYAKLKINNTTLGSSQNLIISVDTVNSNENINVISNFTTGGNDISKSRINNIKGVKYLEIYLENTNGNNIKVNIENGDITNWITTEITKVEDNMIVQNEYEFKGLLFGVSDTLEVSKENVKIGGNLLTSIDAQNSNIGDTVNRWNDIYAKGAIRLGSGTGKEGAIRFNIEKQVLEFSNDGTNWLQLGDLSSQSVISPEYLGAILFADGSDNFGSMTSDAEESTGSFRNYYEWVSDKETLQDYDILVRITLPDDFVSWKEDAIYLDLMTENSASVNNNKVDMYLMGKSGIDAQVNDGISKLPGAWERVSINGSEITECKNAGDTCTLRISLSSLQSYFVRVGDITLNYNRGL